MFQERELEECWHVAMSVTGVYLGFEVFQTRVVHSLLVPCSHKDAVSHIFEQSSKSLGIGTLCEGLVQADFLVFPCRGGGLKPLHSKLSEKGILSVQCCL